jgi:hypothetical protein
MHLWRRSVFLPRSLQTLPCRRWRNNSLPAISDRHDCRWSRLCLLRVVVQQVLHVALSQRLWDPVHAHLQSRAQSLRLQCVLGTKFARTLGHYARVSMASVANIPRALPSSCRLSMSACFCASVIVIAPRFAGLRSGVWVSSSPVFVGSMAEGTGKDGMRSLDALADAICFCFRGGILCELCSCRGLLAV